MVNQPCLKSYILLSFKWSVKCMLDDKTSDTFLLCLLVIVSCLLGLVWIYGHVINYEYLDWQKNAVMALSYIWPYNDQTIKNEISYCRILYPFV